MNMAPITLARLLLLVLFCSDRVASISELKLSYNLNEHHSVGFSIGNLSTDTSLISTIGRKDLQFHLAKPNHWFEVDGSTGVIKNKNLVDLEDLCPTSFACSAGGVISLMVTVSVKGLADHTKTVAMVTVTVNINDINDNSPQFEEKPVFEKDIGEIACTSVPSNCLIREFPLPVAKDRDFSSLNNKVTYTLDRTDDTFALKMKNAEPFMEILKGLDYERQKAYEFVLLARDIGQRSDNITIRIKILDFNDNVPTFSQSLYEISVAESIDRGTIVYKLIANDADVDSKLSYKIKNSGVAVFQIDNEGVVRTTAKLDYEHIKRYDLQVTADDGLYSNSTKLVVYVTDKNDNAPEWKLQSALNVQENSPPASISVVRVWDQDSGDNGKVVCFDPVNDHDVGLIFKRRTGEDNAFDLVTTRPFDREREAQLTALLTCYDNGFPQLTATLTQTVDVTDRNDNAPRFLHNVIPASIMENVEPGVSVTQVSANDEDIGLNSQIYYELATPDFADTFHIDNSTGRITILKSLDRETREVYYIKVLAIDLGKPLSLTGSTFVNITVLDDNDHTPHFLANQELKLPENRNVPFYVGRLKAVDGDAGANGELHFEQLPSGNAHKFLVHSNGSVVALQTFDREALHNNEDQHQQQQQQQQDCVFINVCVRDKGKGNTPCGSSDASAQRRDICVTILDENDHAPIFIQPANFSTPIVISINTHHVGSKVVQFRARDLDKDENARITYSIKSFGADPMFTINAQTGLMTVIRKLTISDMQAHKLVVIASDNGQSIKQITNIVSIIITNEPAKNAISDEIITEMQTRRNIMIIIVLASVSAILAIILIMAILCVNRPCCTSPWANGHVSSSIRSFKYPQSHVSHLTEDGLDCLSNNRMDDGTHLPVGAWSLSSNPEQHQHHRHLDEQFILRERLLDTQNSNVLCDNKRGLCVDKLAMTIDGRAINGGSLCAVNNPPPRYATTGRVAKPAKSEQVKFWLYQIKEDGPASPSRSIRPQGCSRQPGCDIMDSGQSDSGRGCSDEDLPGQCNGMHHHQQQQPPQLSSVHLRVGNSCKSCSGQMSMETFQSSFGATEDVHEEAMRSRYETCSPHRQLNGKDAVTYDTLHSTCDELLPSGQQTPATLRRLPGAIVTPPTVLVALNAGQFPQMTANKFV